MHAASTPLLGTQPTADSGPGSRVLLGQTTKWAQEYRGVSSLAQPRRPSLPSSGVSDAKGQEGRPRDEGAGAPWPQSGRGDPGRKGVGLEGTCTEQPGVPGVAGQHPGRGEHTSRGGFPTSTTWRAPLSSAGEEERVCSPRLRAPQGRIAPGGEDLAPWVSAAPAHPRTPLQGLGQQLKAWLPLRPLSRVWCTYHVSPSP